MNFLNEYLNKLDEKDSTDEDISIDDSSIRVKVENDGVEK